MSYLRGRGAENRRSVFYTGNSSAEDWELVEAPPFSEQKPSDTHRRKSPLLQPWTELSAEGPVSLRIAPTCGKSLASLSDSFGSAFNFDFVRNPSRPKRLSGRDMMGSWKLRSPESSAVEPNGSKASDARLQGQQEELSRLQQEEAKLREELAAQKVQLCFWWGKPVQI